ncbi:MAG: hypothetical protein C5B51_04980 [Terriglobia bacterium]|nr:MAG: hypothetical protein C5B51_04980 [Terriglobia bacterium]
MTEKSSPVTVLLIASRDEDAVELSDMLTSSQGTLCPGSKLRLKSCPSSGEALLLLRSNPVPVVLCEHDHGGASWKELLDKTSSFTVPPYIIVVSRAADEHLWAEALNLGAYDVLAKPFDATEVSRVLGSALHRYEQGCKAASSTAVVRSSCPTALLSHAGLA